MKCHLILPQRRGAGISFSTRKPSVERQKIKKKKRQIFDITRPIILDTNCREESERKGENEWVSEFGA